MVHVIALALAAAVPLSVAQLNASPVKDIVVPVKDSVAVTVKDLVAGVAAATGGDVVNVTDAPLPLLPGILVGYVNGGGLFESSCYSGFPSPSGVCTLQSYQAYIMPVGQPVAYGDRLIAQTNSYMYPTTQYTSMSPTLQNLTVRNFDLKHDCKIPLYNTALTSGAVQFPPRRIAKIDEASGNATLVPEVRDQQLQILAFNNSVNYSQPNQTYFRIYDVDMSHETECRVRESGPDVDGQLAMNIGYGSLRCAVRKDVIDSNVTGVVRSTHFAIVAHDITGAGSYATCRGTDQRGYQQSCYRLIKITSYVAVLCCWAFVVRSFRGR
jgi:hypothetical protein